MQYPIASLGSRVAAIGHLNANADVDGGIRAEPLVLRYYDAYFPSLSLLVAAKSLNLGPADIKAKLGEEVRLGNLRIPTDGLTQMNTFFYKDRGDRPAFQVDSFYDVLTGKIPAKYQDKIVLIGATAAGVGASQVTPVSPAMAPVLTLAHSVSSILQEHFRDSDLGRLRLACRLPPRCRLPDRCCRACRPASAPSPQPFAAGAAGGHPFGLMVGAGMWIQLMAAASPAGHRPPAADDQALPRHRARQGEIGGRVSRVESHAGLAFRGRPARHGFRQVPQVSA